MGMFVDLTMSNFACFRLVKLLSFERAMDTVVWQLLASVICPGRFPVLSAGSQFCTHACKRVNACCCLAHAYAYAYADGA